MAERSHGMMAERLLRTGLSFHVSSRLWRANDRATYLFVERARRVDFYHPELSRRRH